MTGAPWNEARHALAELAGSCIGDGFDVYFLNNQNCKLNARVSGQQ
jgi:hypothetical protein